jgi:carbonic anhydrase
MRTHTRETQENLTPQMALNILKEGNDRFINNIKAHRNLLEQVNETSAGQFPFATILSCIDSRISAELVFDQGLGDIFSIRIAGNIINEDILGSMELACRISGSKVIVVLGHTRCGAIESACNKVEMGYISRLLKKIKPALDMETLTKVNRNGKNPGFVLNVTMNNITHSTLQIREKSIILSEMEASGRIMITGGLYDVENGKVVFFDV